MKKCLSAVTAVFVITSLIGGWHVTADAATVQDLTGRVIILDAGHGKGDSPGYAGYVEHETMLKLAHKIKPLLEARGATVHLTRPTEYNTPLHVRAGIINKLALESVREARRRELAQTPGREADLQKDLLEIGRLLAITQNIIDDPDTYCSYLSQRAV